MQRLYIIYLAQLHRELVLLLVSLLAYLPHLYAEMRLDYLGFDFDGWSDEDRPRKITSELRDNAIKNSTKTL
ncbi:hypothetical protein [Anabaena sp. CCY 9910]|uniref:hypothetical protein n=1 Tax=Anabaena sp. CCY 9910 TaxID=3103870 RepID=UPI0039E19248